MCAHVRVWPPWENLPALVCGRVRVERCDGGVFFIRGSRFAWWKMLRLIDTGMWFVVVVVVWVVW